MRDRGAGEVAGGALGEHGRLRDQVRARLEVAELLALAAAALVARADAAHDAVLDEQLVRGGLGQDVHARLLRLLAEEAAELRDRGDVVAVVAERRRRGHQRDRALLGHEVDRVLRHRAVGRPVLLRQVREELLHRRRVHHRARHQVRAGALALLDERDRHLAEALHQLLVLADELHQPDRARQPGRAAAHDHDAYLDPLVLGIGRRGDELLARLDVGQELSWCRGHPGSALLGLDRLGQLGDDLVQVAHDAEVGELEDRRVRVLVDRDDVLRATACRPCAGSRPRCPTAR